jgi:hypothetical protein
MKNLTVFLVIVLSLFVFSCDKSDDPVPEPEREYAQYKAVVFASQDDGTSARFTLKCVPTIESLNSRVMKKEGNMLYFDFSLERAVYEGELIEVNILVIYRDEQGNISERYERQKTLTVEDTGEVQKIEFTVP